MSAAGETAPAAADELRYAVLGKKVLQGLVNKDRLALAVQDKAEVEHTVHHLVDQRRPGDHFMLALHLRRLGFLGGQEFCGQFFSGHIYFSRPDLRRAAVILAMTIFPLKGLMT